jgi:hypothetical protein
MTLHDTIHAKGRRPEPMTIEPVVVQMITKVHAYIPAAPFA